MEDRRVTVLFVEDHSDSSFVIKLTLEWLGFDVVAVPDGAVALAALEQFTPDVILLDLVMPTLDGWEFLRRYPGPVPVVVYSAWVSEDMHYPREPFATVAKPRDVKAVAPVLRRAAASWRI